jgi:hypothetical protein
MNLREKMLHSSAPVILYGTTPPRAGTSEEKTQFAAERLAERVQSLPLDGLVVYDVQDESDRTDEPRPFPYVPTQEPRPYAHLLQERTGLPPIAYKCIAGLSAASWHDWLTAAADTYGLSFLSPVGLPSSRGHSHPLTLSAATRQAASHPHGFTLGGVVIAERHSPERSESQRLLGKAENGCRFFISQAVYAPDATIRLLRDYRRECAERGVAPRRILFTFTPCGRPQTLAFMKWLGIAIPPETEAAILGDPAPLSRSLALCRDNLRRILDAGVADGLPLGINVESVSIHRAEIDATVDLVPLLHAELTA